MQNQHQEQQQNKTLISAGVNANQFPACSRSSNWSLSNSFHKQGNLPPLYFSNCVGNWLTNNREKCIAKRKTCNNCGLLNHFDNVFQKQKNSKPQNSKNTKKRTINTEDKEPHPEDSVNFLQSSQLYESNYGSGEDNMVALIQNDIAKTEPLNMPMKNWQYLDSSTCGFACSILNRSLASQVVRRSSYTFWIQNNTIWSPSFKTILQKKEPPNMPIKIGNISTTPLVDFGSACSNLNQFLASQIVKSSHMHSGFAIMQTRSSGPFRMNRLVLRVKYKLRYRATERLHVRLHSMSSLTS